MEKLYTLSPEQILGANFAMAAKYCILAMDVGTGKSLTALHAAFNSGGKRILVVVPSYLAYQWKAECKKFFPEKVVSVFYHVKEFHDPWDVDIVICTYQYVDEAQKLFNWCDTVICDEAHYLKNMETDRGGAIHTMVFENSLSRAYLLSGTIMENRVHELHSPLALMEYNPRFPESKFLKRFPNFIDFATYFSTLEEVVKKRGNRRWVERKWKGVKNKEELQKYLKKHMIVIKSQDNIPFEDRNILISDIKDQALLNEFNAFLADPESHGMSGTAKVRSAMAKVKVTVEHAKNLNRGGRPIIIFSDHIESAKKIAELLKCPCVTGATPANIRQREVNRFNEGDIEYLVATIGSLSTGYNLQQSCSDMIFNDYPWKPTAITQARGRIMRKNQKNKCTFYFILGSIQDEYILGTLTEKKELIKEVIYDE
jgi:SNF2 family DNA or RNA helicase